MIASKDLDRAMNDIRAYRSEIMEIFKEIIKKTDSLAISAREIEVALQKSSNQLLSEAIAKFLERIK